MKPPAGFAGFGQGKQRLTPIPAAFFSDLLPQINDLGELKVTLYAIWALDRKQGRFRYLRLAEMASDRLLMQALGGSGGQAMDRLREALERAVARGTLLEVKATGGEEDSYYFLNSPKGRSGAKALAEGRWRPSDEPPSPVELELERPNIFRLYEQNIGPLTPMMAERLRQAEIDYPAGWIEEAIEIALDNNVRKWRYIEAILEDWHLKGRDERKDRGDSEKARRRYIEGEFAKWAKE
jgi:DNA replication protein